MIKCRLYKKLIIMITIVCLIANVFLPYPFVQAQQNLSMKDAAQFGTINSYDLSQLKIELTKKKLELTQARQGLDDLRKKESTIKFSLLFNLELPQGHGLPKEIDMVTKIPSVQSEIGEVQASIGDTKNKVECDVETEYLNTVVAQVNVENNQMTLDEEQQTLKMLNKRYKLGEATAAQLKSKQEEIDGLSQALKKSILTFENEKTSLSDLIGIDVTYGYTFDRKFITVNVERNNLGDIVNSSRNGNLDLFKANEKLKLAQGKVQSMLEIYKSAFGSDMGSVEAELNKPGVIDYDTLLSKYQDGLELIRKRWEGFFFIPLLFFIIPIPKSWLQPEYAGLRYFENQKYALPLALIERDQTRAETEKAKKDHDKAIKDGYSNLKDIEDAYNSTEKAYENSQVAYKNALRSNKLGKMSFEDLEAAKKDVRGKAVSAISNLADYNKKIYMFNRQSSGAMKKYISSTIINLGGLGTGISFNAGESKDAANSENNSSGGSNEVQPSQPAGDTGKWFIDSSDIDYRVYFRVTVPKSIDATHYALFTSDGRQIGTKTEINKRISHMPIMFTDISDLIVKFYKGNNLLAAATLDGFDVQGDLKIVKAAAPDNTKSKTISGKWSIAKGEVAIISNFGVTVDSQLGATHYELFSAKGVQIGVRTAISMPISHLSSVFASTEGMKLRLYKDDKLIALAALGSNGELKIETLNQ